MQYRNLAGAPDVRNLPETGRTRMAFAYQADTPATATINILIDKRDTAGTSMYFCGLVNTQQPMGESVSLFGTAQAKEILGLTAELPSEEPFFGPFNELQANAFLKLVQDISVVAHFSSQAERSQELLTRSLAPVQNIQRPGRAP